MNNLHNFMEKFQIIGLVSYVNIPNIPLWFYGKAKLNAAPSVLGNWNNVTPPQKKKKQKNKNKKKKKQKKTKNNRV